MSGFDTTRQSLGKLVKGDTFFRLHLAMQLIDADIKTRHFDGGSVLVRGGQKDRRFKGDQHFERFYVRYNPSPDHPNQVHHAYGLIEEQKESRGGAIDHKPFFWRKVRDGEYAFYHVIEERACGPVDMSASWWTD